MDKTVKLTEFPIYEIDEEARAEAEKIVYDNSVSVIKNSREQIEREFKNSNTEWIKCTDRPPEDGTWNLWIDKAGRIQKARYKEDCGGGKFYPQGEVFDFENAVGWKDLP